jgi:Nif-specific regulatory protein
MSDSINKISRAELEKLVLVSERLSSTIQLEKLLEIILDSAQSITKAEAASLLLLDETINKLKFTITTGKAKETLKGLVVPLGNASIAGFVAQSGRPLIVNDVIKDSKWYGKIDLETQFKTRSILCVPLLIQDSTVGVVEVINKKTQSGFTGEDQELLSHLARQAALAIRNARHYQELSQSKQYILDALEPRFRIVGKSAPLKKAMALAQRVSETQTTVLILGESGTGKELMARYIHNHSLRKDAPFLIVNCAAIPATLIESELFGYEKGAFTGAANRKLGKFELAQHGTLFLDEIGDLALETQVKILRFLEDRAFQRLGGKDNITVDIRILTATNQRLEDLVKEKKIREDLYYRLNVFPIELPPLRERRDDIPLLVEHFIEIFNYETTKKIKKILPKTLALLQSYDWPGNIRELRNVVERAFVLTPADTILPEHVILTPPATSIEETNQPWLEAVHNFKRQYLMKTLRQVQGNHRDAAELLKIRPSYLSRLKKELNIDEI